MGDLPSFTSVDSYGLPTNDGTSAPSNVDIQNPNQSSNSGVLATLEGWGTSVVHGIESVGSDVASAAESGIKTVYQGGKTVVGDVVSGVEGVGSFATSQLVIVILAVGVGLYLIGKGGLKIPVVL
jgi:hypothetical protein